MKVASLLAAISVAFVATSDATAEVGDLERGVAQFQRGQFRSAIVTLAPLHAADPSDLDVALLLGIAYYRIDELDRAHPLLESALRSLDVDTRDSARIFLGLIADSGGANDEARGYYQAVARSSSELANSGRRLLDGSRRDRAMILAVVRLESDSNVALLPSSAAAGSKTGAADADLFALVGASVRPSDALRLVLEDNLSYRKQAQLASYDVLSNVAGAAWRHADRFNRDSIEYHLDTSLLGGAHYQTGQIVDIAGYRKMIGSFGVGASYQLTARTYYPDAYVGYSGTTHTISSELSWATSRLDVGASYMLGREYTDDPSLSAFSNGLRLSVRTAPWLGADLRANVLAADRAYAEPSLGRHDTQIKADAALYIDLSSHLGAVVGFTVIDNASNDPDYDFVKWTTYIGIVGAVSPGVGSHQKTRR